MLFRSVYAKALGQTENRSTLLVSIFVGGPIVLQYPFAWLGDHFTKRNVLIASAAFSYLAYILLPIAVDTFVVWILLAFLGAATACLYTLSLARLGEKYRGNDLVAGTAVFSAVYGFGSLIGSSTTGTVMSVLGAASFPYVLGAILVVLIIVAAVASEF